MYQKTTNFNVSPYYDDYSINDNFYRILFRPKRAVQARELTQLQTIIQDQISRFGNHIFQNGSVVLDGQLSLNTKDIKFVKLSSTNISTTTWETTIKGKVLTGGTSSSKAKVIHYEPATSTTLTGSLSSTGTTTITGSGTLFTSELEPGSHVTISGSEMTVESITSNTEITVKTNLVGTFSSISGTKTDPATLFVQYISGNSETTSNVFTSGETLTVEGITSTVETDDANFNPTTPTGDSSVVFIESGVYYMDGFFIYIDSAILVLDKYRNTPTYKVGLTKLESLIDSNDSTYGTQLLDPSQGTSNYLAPGADRFQISLNLSKKSITSSETGDFIEILRLDSGTITKHNKYPIYSNIESTLARRTYDESGNYVVNQFGVHLENHASDTTKFNVAVGPGKAYVFGHEYENPSTRRIAVDKARNTQATNNADIYCVFGNYFLADTLSGVFSIDTFEKVRLRDAGDNNIGTANIRQILYESGTIGDSSCVYRVYLFNFSFDSDQKDYRDVKKILSYSTNTGSCEIATSGEDSSGNSLLLGKESDQLVWKFPNSPIQAGSINDVSYQIRKRFGEQTFSNGSLTITPGNATFSFIGSGTLTTNQKAVNYHVVAKNITNADGTGITNGSIISFSATDSNGTRSISVSNGQATFSIPGNTGAFAGTVDVIATMEVDESTAEGTKTKTLVEANTITVSGSTDYTKGQIVVDTGYDTNDINLGVADIYELEAVYEETDGDGIVDINTIATTKNITSRFTLDNGQRKNYYDHGRISLKDGETAPTNKLLVLVNYFTHSGDGYFTVDSYTSSGLADGYTDIPEFTNPTTGKTNNLRDLLDFRPRKGNGTTTETFSGSPIPYAETAWESDYNFYLPRIDKIYLDDSLNMGVITGISSLNPIEPNDLSNSMTLYVLEIPAYTFNVNNISTHILENRRYTMRDIGSLQRRIQKLEYYTSLSLLEREADDLIILDTNGLERFKSGILVDSFRGHSIGDIGNDDYSCSIDPKRGELRPPFTSNSIGLSDGFQPSESSGVTKTGNLVTCPYTTESLVAQTQASKSIEVNPYDVSSFIGTMELTPSSDTWIDTTTRPDVLVNLEGNNDAWEFISNTSSTTGFGTQWDDWNTIWSGDEILSTEQTIQRSRDRDSRNDAFTIQREIISTESLQTRTGIGWSISPETTQKSIGNRVVDVSIIPYIRNQTITIDSNGLKPNTRLYPYFDGTDVSQYCNSGNVIYSDATGSVNFSFSVPAGIFRTGDRIFRLTDDSSNDITTATTFSETQFHASGILQTVENTIISTRVPELQKNTFTENQTSTNVFVRETITQDEPDWIDPLAQTFLIDGKKYPQGLFLSDIDLYFATKPTESSLDQLPVTVQIRETTNGYPSQKIVPFSTVTKTPTNINIPTSDADYESTPTNFQFASPVYLKPGEYAITILTNSKDYKVFSAQLGDDILGTSRKISKQPYAGVLFRSQNASTWNASQEEDLAFKLNKCVFTTGTGTAIFHNISQPTSDIEYDLIQLNAQELEYSGASISWSYKATSNSTETLDGSFTGFISNENHELSERKQASSVSSSTGTLIAKASLTTDNANISPVIDTERLHAIIVSNNINNSTTGETSSSADLTNGATTRYITRRVTLEENSNDLRVYLTAYKPPQSNINVYYKILGADDDSTFDSRPWVLMPQHSNSNITSNNNVTYKELEYRPSLSPINYTNETSGSAIQRTFKQFAIKIVLTSSDTTKIPRIKDMRAIAISD